MKIYSSKKPRQSSDLRRYVGKNVWIKVYPLACVHYTEEATWVKILDIKDYICKLNYIDDSQVNDNCTSWVHEQYYKNAFVNRVVTYPIYSIKIIEPLTVVTDDEMFTLKSDSDFINELDEDDWVCGYISDWPGFYAINIVSRNNNILTVRLHKINLSEYHQLSDIDIHDILNEYYEIDINDLELKQPRQSMTTNQLILFFKKV